MNIQVICYWPSAVHLFEQPTAEVERILQHAIEALSQELQEKYAEEVDASVLTKLEQNVHDQLLGLLPKKEFLNLTCQFMSPNLLVIDVTQKIDFHTQVSGILH